MKKIILGTLLITSTIFAAEGQSLFNKCVGCHGANGEKVALGKSKIIKDLTKEEIVTALNGYKDGSYGGVMKGVMKGQVMSLSDDDILVLAEYISEAETEEGKSKVDGE